MRKPGELRLAIRQAVTQTTGATWRELAARSGVGFDAAKQTVRNMERAGELVVIGQTRIDGCCRPANVYAAADAANDGMVGFEQIEALLRAWAR